MFKTHLRAIFPKGEWEVNDVPVVIVEMWEGKNVEQKETVIKGITKVFEDMGTKAAAVTVVLHDVPKSSWGMGGQQASKL